MQETGLAEQRQKNVITVENRCYVGGYIDESSFSTVETSKCLRGEVMRF